MVWLDIIILAVIIIAAIYGLAKGLIRGLFGIIALIAGIWIASRTFKQVVEYLPFGNSTVSNILSFIIIFLVVAIVITIIGFIIRKIIRFASLGWIDRIFGVIFGFVIGVFINWIICILILSFAPNGRDVIADSKLAPPILSAGSFLRKYFPKPRIKEKKHVEESTANIDNRLYYGQFKDLTV